MNFENDVLDVTSEIATLLIEKNKAYGNSALDPVRIFSKASNIEQLNVRIDDKLSRLSRGGEYPGDDTITDLLGYLVLYKIQLKNSQTQTITVTDNDDTYEHHSSYYDTDRNR